MLFNRSPHCSLGILIYLVGDTDEIILILTLRDKAANVVTVFAIIFFPCVF